MLAVNVYKMQFKIDIAKSHITSYGLEYDIYII